MQMPCIVIILKFRCGSSVNTLLAYLTAITLGKFPCLDSIYKPFHASFLSSVQRLIDKNVATMWIVLFPCINGVITLFVHSIVHASFATTAIGVHV